LSLGITQAQQKTNRVVTNKTQGFNEETEKWRRRRKRNSAESNYEVPSISLRYYFSSISFSISYAITDFSESQLHFFFSGKTRFAVRDGLLCRVSGLRFFNVSTEEYAKRNYASNVAEYNTVLGSLNAQRRFLFLFIFIWYCKNKCRNENYQIVV
jgi:hypothetical protein